MCFSWHFRSLCPRHGCSFRVGAEPGEERKGRQQSLLWLPQAPCPALCHSPPAHGAVLRLTSFSSEPRSRLGHQSVHHHAGHSSSADSWPQPGPCCFLPECSDASFLCCPELMAVISGGTAGCGPAPPWGLQNDEFPFFKKKKGMEGGEPG